MNLLFLQDGYLGTDWSFDAPSWCISICFFCYIMLYYVLYKTKNEIKAYYVFGVAAIIGTAVIASDLKLPLINSLMGRGIACFSIGVILSGIYKNHKKFKSLRLGYLCLAISVFFYCVSRFCPEYTGNFHIAFILGAAPAVILSTVLLPWLNKFLGILPLRYLGEISIGIYLFHFPVQCFIKNIESLLNAPINFSGRKIWFAYAATVLISATIYKFLIQKHYEKFICEFFKKSHKADIVKN